RRCVCVCALWKHMTEVCVCTLETEGKKKALEKQESRAPNRLHGDVLPRRREGPPGLSLVKRLHQSVGLCECVCVFVCVCAGGSLCVCVCVLVFTISCSHTHLNRLSAALHLRSSSCCRLRSDNEKHSSDTAGVTTEQEWCKNALIHERNK